MFHARGQQGNWVMQTFDMVGAKRGKTAQTFDLLNPGPDWVQNLGAQF